MAPRGKGRRMQHPLHPHLALQMILVSRRIGEEEEGDIRMEQQAEGRRRLIMSRYFGCGRNSDNEFERVIEQRCEQRYEQRREQRCERRCEQRCD